MLTREQIDRDLMAIEVNAVRVAEIAALRRERDFWRQRCARLEEVVEMATAMPVRRVQTNAAAGCEREGRGQRPLLSGGPTGGDQRTFVDRWPLRKQG